QVFFPAPSGRRLASPWVFLDFAALAASDLGRGSAAPARQTFLRETVGFRSATRTVLCLAKKHRFADRIVTPAVCVPVKNNAIFPPPIPSRSEEVHPTGPG